MTAPYEITAAEHLGEHRLRLWFADGLVGDVDLSERLLRSEVGPVFQPFREIAFFAQVAVDVELGTIVWPNGADFAPDVLHDKVLSPA